MNLIRLAAALCVFGVSGGASAYGADAPVSARLVIDHAAVSPGELFEAALELTPEPGWHTYWKNPGDIGFAPQLEWSATVGLEPSALLFEVPERVSSGNAFTNYGYESATLISVVARLPQSVVPGSRVTVQVKGKWLVCKDVCVPAKGTFQANIEVAAPGKNQISGPEVQAHFFKSRKNRPQLWPKSWSLNWSPDPKVPRWWGVVEARGGIPLPLQGPTSTAIDFFPHEKGILRASAIPQLGLRGQASAPNRSLKFECAAEKEAWVSSRSFNGTGILKLGEDFFEMARSEDRVTWGRISSGTDSSLKRYQEIAGAILGAFLGGIILNLMPCVFPVLWLKALKLISIAHQDRKRRIRGALAYTLGILLSFWGVSFALMALRASGQSLGWGFQLQSPAFVFFMAALFGVIALNLAGAFEFVLPSLGVLGRRRNERVGTADEETWHSSLSTGVLAVTVATPCTAPFMGTALGYALTAPIGVGFLIFTALGFGLALPYLVLSVMPNLGRFLPKPGAWMEVFKKALAVPMLLTVAWLLWVLSLQRGWGSVALALLGLLGMTAVLVRLGMRQRRGLAISLSSWLVLGLPLLSVVFALAKTARPLSLGEGLGLGSAAVSSGDPTESPWRIWSPEGEALARQNSAVFIDFTAAWCVTCQVNEQVALNRDEVMDLFRKKQVTLLKADWTDEDPRITRALAAYGRSGVPLYVLIPRGGEPVLLPQILTVQSVLDELNRLP